MAQRGGKAQTPTVLVVDDERAPRQILARRLEAAGLEVLQAADGIEAWERFQRREPQLVVTDMAMPHSDGLDLTGRIRERSDVPIIVFSSYASVPRAVSAVKAGADEFVSSLDLDVEALVRLACDLCRGSKKRSGHERLAERLPGTSAAIEKVRARLVALAPLRVPVLLIGEPGVGRTTAARALHELGPTADLDFFTIEAARFQPSMPAPERGTVLLRGVEQLSPGGQAFWARRLAGMSEGRPLRIVASTARSPREWKRGTDRPAALAREFLRYQITIPAFRQRKEDLGDISEIMLSRVGGRLGRPGMRLSEPAIERLMSCSWPGNGTELASLLAKAIAYSEGREISGEVIEELLSERDHSLVDVREERESREREDLLAALRETGGNISRTAERLGLSRQAVYRLMEKCGIPVGRDRRGTGSP